MDAGFAIFFWLILAAIYGFFLVFLALWYLGKKKNNIWLKWFGAVPSIGMAVIALATADFMAWGIVYSKNLHRVFKETFNTSPLPSISELQSSFYSIADTGVVYLRFKTTQQEFDKLVTTNLVKENRSRNET